MPTASNSPPAMNGHVVELSQETQRSQPPSSYHASSVSITGSQEPLLSMKDTMDRSRSARERAVGQQNAPSLSTEVSFRSEDEEQDRFADAKDATQDEQDKQDRETQEVKPSMLFRICSKILCGRSRK